MNLRKERLPQEAYCAVARKEGKMKRYCLLSRLPLLSISKSFSIMLLLSLQERQDKLTIKKAFSPFGQQVKVKQHITIVV